MEHGTAPAEKGERKLGVRLCDDDDDDVIFAAETFCRERMGEKAPSEYKKNSVAWLQLFGCQGIFVSNRERMLTKYRGDPCNLDYLSEDE